MNANDIRFLNIALALLTFPVLALLARDVFVLGFAEPAVKVATDRALAQEERVPAAEFAPIVEDPVFPAPARKFSSVAAAPVEAAAAAPKAAAGAVLSGVELSGTYVGTPAFAIFTKKEKNIQDVVRVGDEVMDGWVLKEVRPSEAVLESAGRTLTLSIPAEDIPKAPPLSYGVPRTRVSEPATARRDEQAAGDFKTSRKVGENEWVISKDAVQDALSDMSQVLTAARLTPHVVNGNVEGFLVTEIRPRGVVDAIGLRNGDILKRVNGYEITSPERAVQVLSALKGETSFDLDVVRGGSNMSFHYEVR